MSKDEKSLYKVKAQTNDLTIAYIYSNEMTDKEVIDVTKFKIKTMETIYDKLQPFVITELTTRERWDRGTINFCPRCGERIEDLEGYANFDCYECGASCCVVIDVGEEDE